MFSNTETEILSSKWAISKEHSNAWLSTVANILIGKNVFNADLAKIKDSQKEMRSFVIDENGDRVNRTEQTPYGSIGVILIAGPMLKYGDWNYYGAEELVANAYHFDNDPGIIGQIWLHDSGGGSINAIAPYLEFYKRKQKPVIGLADTCASANLYVGVGGDKLFARNNISAMFGSIGVMATIVDYREYLKKLGVEEHLIYATQSSFKHKSSTEALNGKYETFRKEHLNPVAIQFQNFVKTSRPKLKTDVEGILEGKMFYAESALEHGLIDGIIDFEAAVEEVKMLAGARSFMNQ